MVLALLLAAGAWMLHDTGYESRSVGILPDSSPRGAPAWSRPCWRQDPPPYSGMYILACARVDGRVVYREKLDPDGDGDSHLLVVAGVHLVNLKFRGGAGVVRLPDLGRQVVATGLLHDGRFGVPEVEVLRLG